jgi:hypothetical protein
MSSHRMIGIWRFFRILLKGPRTGPKQNEQREESCAGKRPHVLKASTWVMGDPDTRTRLLYLVLLSVTSR